MFIAFEGVDGAGKSGLARAVADEIRKTDRDGTVQEIHHGPLDKPPLDAYVHSVGDYVPTSGRHIVGDRWHWGEEIYGPLYRDKSALTLGQFRWIEMWLASRGANIWHVTQPIDRLRKRLTARGEDFLQSHHVDHVKSEFQRRSDDSMTCFGTLEPEGDTKDLVTRILNRARYSETEIGTRIHRFPSYVGPALPRVLLVGEKRGGQPPHPTTSAFLPVNGNSGEFLLSSLASDFWRVVALVNGVEEGDNLTQLVEELAGPSVIALGRAASDVLLDLGIDHGGVPHPQYVRRFHNKRQREYGAMIREFARTNEMRFSWPS